MLTISELLREHVSLDVECVDRVYMNGYLPALQTSGGLVYFLEHQRGQPIASPALLGEITQNFVTQVEALAKREGIPMVHFEKGQRKDDVAAGYRRKFAKAEGLSDRPAVARFRVASICAAQRPRCSRIA